MSQLVKVSSVFLFCFHCLLLPPGAMADSTLLLQGLTEEYTTYVLETLNKEFEDPDSLSEFRLEQHILGALKAKGFYNADISSINSDQTTGLTTISIHPGERFSIAAIYVNPHIPEADSLITALLNKPLDAQDVLTQQQLLLEQLRSHGCSYGVTIDHKVALDREKHQGDVTITIDRGADAHFGPTTFDGADDIDREYLYQLLSYKEGECWNKQQLHKSISQLLGSGLLSAALPERPKEPLADGSVPIHFKLKARAKRTIRLGVSFFTDERLGGIIDWSNRNIGGAGESLAFRLRANYLRQTATLIYKIPQFLDSNQSLSVNSKLEHEDNDTFEERSFLTEALIHRDINKFFSIDTGPGYELLNIEEDGETETYGLIYIIGGFTLDTRSEPLDPRDGIRVSGRITPYYDVLDEVEPFIRSEVSASTYLEIPLFTYKPVLAFRTGVGTISNNSTEEIPASKRFYAGGGGSIRGVGFQEAGPFDSDGDPLGGRSLLELSTELRMRFSESFGGVLFVDAGRVYDEEYPTLDNSLFVGAGPGIRYFTGFGPLRLDVGFPVTKRDLLEDKFQVYISIGQAF